MKDVIIISAGLHPTSSREVRERPKGRGIRPTSPIKIITLPPSSHGPPFHLAAA